MSTPQGAIGSLRDQFVYELEGVYDMELKLVDALENMSRQTTNDNLASGFETHREETERHVERVEAAFDALGVDPSRRDNAVADGLIENTARFERTVTDDDMRNLHYLNAGMMTERVEMTAYEGLLLTADKADIGDDVTDYLEENLDEEEKTLKKLKGLSTGSELKQLWNRLTGG